MATYCHVFQIFIFFLLGRPMLNLGQAQTTSRTYPIYQPIFFNRKVETLTASRETWKNVKSEKKSVRYRRRRRQEIHDCCQNSSMFGDVYLPEIDRAADRWVQLKRQKSTIYLRNVTTMHVRSISAGAYVYVRVLATYLSTFWHDRELRRWPVWCDAAAIAAPSPAIMINARRSSVANPGIGCIG